MTRLFTRLLFGAFGVAVAGSQVAAQVVDTGFAALQARGKTAMGVDQYTSTHKFDALPDGGRIELQRDHDDSVGVAEIRRHLRQIAAAFQAGDFSTPVVVHRGEVAGARVMAAKRSQITYTFRPLPRGGEVRIITKDPEALRAIQEFMAFQRHDHHAGGRDHDAMPHTPSPQPGVAPVDTGSRPSSSQASSAPDGAWLFWFVSELATYLVESGTPRGVTIGRSLTMGIENANVAP